MKKLFFIGLFFVISAFVFAQNNFETVVRSDYRKGVYAVQELGNKYVMVGYTDIISADSLLPYILELKKDGSLLNQRILSSDTLCNYAFQNMHYASNRLYLVGHAEHKSTNKYYTWVMEMDTALHMLKQTLLPIPDNYQRFRKHSIIDTDGNIVIAGDLLQLDTPYIQGVLYKINRQGELLVSMTDTVFKNKSFRNIIESPDHSQYYVFGEGGSQITGTVGQMWIFDKQLGSVAVKGLPKDINSVYSPTYLSDTSMAVGSMGSYYYNSNYQLAIVSFPFNSSASVLPAIHYSHFTLDATRQEYAAYNNMTSADKTGHLYLGGTSKVYYGNLTFGHYPSWFHLVKLDYNLTPVWEKWYTHQQDSACYLASCVLATSDDGCLMVGSRYDGNPEYINDVYIIKVDANGEVLWTKEIGIQHKINVYPNPEWPYYVELFNTNGALIKQATGYSQTLSIPMHTQGAGLYLYKVYNHKHQLLSTGKWIKR